YRFVQKAYTLTVKYSLWGSLILLALSFYYFWGKKDPETGWLIVIGASFFPAMFMDRWIMAYMGKGMFTRARTCEVAIKLASIVLAGLAAYYTGNVLIVMACMFLSNLILNPLFALHSLKLLEHSEKNPELDRQYRSYAARITLYTVLPTVARHLDKILIANFLDFNSVSIYYIATIVPMYFQTGLKSGLNVPVQKWVSLGRKEALRKFTGHQWTIIGSSILASAALFLAMPYLIGFFGDDYKSATGFAQVLCLSFAVYPCTTLFFMMLKFLGEERFTGRAMNAYSAVKTLLLFFMVPYYGIIGVVWSQVAMDYAWFCVALHRLRRIKTLWAGEKETGSTVRSDIPDTGISSEDYTEM
ncbi:MAG: hypothetical protein U9P14_10855, partial [Gemmatimonadota bacterium]|nr:hypothetical protein [Gemmatimonadota bacterium]